MRNDLLACLQCCTTSLALKLSKGVPMLLTHEVIRLLRRSSQGGRLDLSANLKTPPEIYPDLLPLDSFDAVWVARRFVASFEFLEYVGIRETFVTVRCEGAQNAREDGVAGFSVGREYRG